MRHLHAGIIRGKVICIRREIHSYARRKKPRYHLSCLPARLQKPLLLIINRRFALPPLSPLPLLLLPFRRRVILKFSPIGTPFYFDILFEIILFNFIILFNDSTICFGTIEFIYGKFQKRWILDFFLSIRLNIKIIRRVYIYRIIERTEENRNSRGGAIYWTVQGGKNCQTLGSPSIIHRFIIPTHRGDLILFSAFVAFEKIFFLLLRINVSGGSSITEERNCYIFICLVEEKFYFYFFLLFFFSLPVLSTVNQVKHRGGTRDVDVSKAVVALHLQTQGLVTSLLVFSL